LSITGGAEATRSRLSRVYNEELSALVVARRDAAVERLSHNVRLAGVCLRIMTSSRRASRTLISDATPWAPDLLWPNVELVDVAPEPVLAQFLRLSNGVVGGMKLLRGVFQR
jgi:hypothetical protein